MANLLDNQRINCVIRIPDHNLMKCLTAAIPIQLQQLAQQIWSKYFKSLPRRMRDFNEDEAGHYKY